MSWLAVAVGGSAGASLISGLVGANAAETAAQQQVAYEQQALQVEQGQFQTAVGALTPYAQAGMNFMPTLQSAATQGTGMFPTLNSYATTGNQAYQTLASLYGVNTPGNQPNWSAFLNTPAYQWASQTGNAALTNTLASQGQVLSGNQLTAISNYNQGLAGQQFTNVTNALQNISGIGATAAGQGVGYGVSAANAGAGIGGGAAGAIGNVASNAANTLGNTTMATGQSAASGTVGASNAITSALSSGTTNSLLLYGLASKYGATASNPSSYLNSAANQNTFSTGAPGVPYSNVSGSGLNLVSQ